METRARVVEVDEKTHVAIVESRRKSACDGCHKNTDGQGCAVCSLMGGDPVIRTRADNRIGAKVGDTVNIAADSTRVMRYAALVFLMPLICGGVAYLIASAITAAPAVQACAALGGFALAFLGLRIYSSRVIARRCDTSIVSIVRDTAEDTTI